MNYDFEGDPNLLSDFQNIETPLNAQQHYQDSLFDSSTSDQELGKDKHQPKAHMYGIGSCLMQQCCR